MTDANNAKEGTEAAVPIIFEGASESEPAQPNAAVVKSASLLAEKLKGDTYIFDSDTGYWYKHGSNFAFRPSGSTANKVKVTWGYDLDPDLLKKGENDKLNKAIYGTITQEHPQLRSMPRLYNNRTLAVGFSLTYTSIDQIFALADDLGDGVKGVIAKHFSVSAEAIGYEKNLAFVCSIQTKYKPKPAEEKK